MPLRIFEDSSYYTTHEKSQVDICPESCHELHIVNNELDTKQMCRGNSRWKRNTKPRLGSPSKIETRRRSAASGAPNNVDNFASPPGLYAT